MLTPTMRWHMSGACLACCVSSCIFSLLVGGDPLRGAIMGTVIYAVIIVLSLPAKVPKPPTNGIVVISSASSGVGFSAAVKLSSLGFQVFGGVRRETDGDVLRKYGCIPIVLDVTSESSVSNAHKRVSRWSKRYNRPMVALVNSAGLQGCRLPVELETQKNMDHLMQVNVFGVFRMYKHFLPLLRQFGPGARIVNIGSVSGHIPSPLTLGFTMSKHSLQALTGVSRAELCRFGISVSIVNAGSMNTSLADQTTAPKSFYRSEKQLKKLRASSPPEMRRLYPSVFDPKKHKELAARAASAVQHFPAPEVAANPAIVHAISSARPRPYYFVGVLGPSHPYMSATFGTWWYWHLPSPTTSQWIDVRDKPQ